MNTTEDLRFENDVLAVENAALKRSRAAHKANFTRQKTNTALLNAQVETLTVERDSLIRSIRAYKANATRRNAARTNTLTV